MSEVSALPVQVPIERRFVRHRRMLTRRRPNVQNRQGSGCGSCSTPGQFARRRHQPRLAQFGPGPIGDAVQRQNLMAVWYWNGELANFKALEEAVL
jgi:hypothetical protein